MINSPYSRVSPVEWGRITHELISQHPLQTDELHEIVHLSWQDILQTRVGSKPFRIGVDIFPAPQIMGFLLHELIPLHVSERHHEWRRGSNSREKDLVYDPEELYSIEIKTSSSKSSIFGNRSYAQKSRSSTSRKSKSGYYLAINFQSFRESDDPRLIRVRFGWLDHEDWIGQASQTGQQARLSSEVERRKLLELPLTP